MSGAQTSDQFQQIWFLDWGAHAVSHAVSPFFSPQMNHPVGINVAANNSMLGLSIPFAPLTEVFGAFATWNVLLRLAVLLSALAAQFACRRVVRWGFASFVAGLIYGFSGYMTFWAIGYLNFIFVPFIPLIFLGLYALFRGKPDTPELWERRWVPDSASNTWFHPDRCGDPGHDRTGCRHCGHRLATCRTRAMGKHTEGRNLGRGDSGSRHCIPCVFRVPRSGQPGGGSPPCPQRPVTHSASSFRDLVNSSSADRSVALLQPVLSFGSPLPRDHMPPDHSRCRSMAPPPASRRRHGTPRRSFARLQPRKQAHRQRAHRPDSPPLLVHQPLPGSLQDRATRLRPDNGLLRGHCHCVRSRRIAASSTGDQRSDAGHSAALAGNSIASRRDGLDSRAAGSCGRRANGPTTDRSVLHVTGGRKNSHRVSRVDVPLPKRSPHQPPGKPRTFRGTHTRLGRSGRCRAPIPTCRRLRLDAAKTVHRPADPTPLAPLSVQRFFDDSFFGASDPAMATPSTAPTPGPDPHFCSLLFDWDGRGQSIGACVVLRRSANERCSWTCGHHVVELRLVPCVAARLCRS